MESDFSILWFPLPPFFLSCFFPFSPAGINFKFLCRPLIWPQVAFEKMLWRVSKGNVFIKFSDIEEEIEDPRTGGSLYKSVFMIFFQVRLLVADEIN